MAEIVNRLANFSARANWLGGVMGSRPAAALFLAQAKFNRMRAGKGSYDKLPFSFRGCDVSAVKEVLIDGEYGFLRSLLDKHETPRILDIGTHIGLFSIWALSVRSKARIFSVEASPSTFKILEGNIRRIQETKPDVSWKAVNRAAWKNTDPIRFSNAGDSMSHRVSVAGPVEVQGITLREVLDTTFPGQTIDLMKVDIEGAEEAFICAEPDLLQAVNALVIELHPNLCDTSRVKQALREVFPNIETITGRTSSKPLLYCRK